MNQTFKIALFTSAISSLLTGHSVMAKTVDAASPSSPPATIEQPKKCDRLEGHEKHLVTLKSDLKLDASQEIAWTEWMRKMKENRQDWQEKRKNAESWASLPALERMEKMLAFSKEHIVRQEARLAATKAFYTTLSSGQRLIFDKEFKFEHHGHAGKGQKK